MVKYRTFIKFIINIVSDTTHKMAPSIGVSEFYAGKTIFITGATGFMGKVLIEKLLRCCPDVKRIYVLMRPKRGQNPKERLDDFINCRVNKSIVLIKLLNKMCIKYFIVYLNYINKLEYHIIDRYLPLNKSNKIIT